MKSSDVLLSPSELSNVLDENPATELPPTLFIDVQDSVMTPFGELQRLYVDAGRFVPASQNHLLRFAGFTKPVRIGPREFVCVGHDGQQIDELVSRIYQAIAVGIPWLSAEFAMSIPIHEKRRTG